jgi:hypothetical protein
MKKCTDSVVCDEMVWWHLAGPFGGRYKKLLAEYHDHQLYGTIKCNYGSITCFN